MFKSRAIIFFNVSAEGSTNTKAYFKREIENFMKMHVNMERGLNRDILRDLGGSGRHWENPPSHFQDEIADENERKKMFSNKWR